MKNKITTNNYFELGITLFLVISASIAVFFAFLRLDIIINLIMQFFKILKPIFLGILFAYLLNPLVNFFENRVFKRASMGSKKSTKYIRGISMFFTYSITLILLFIIIKFGIPSLLNTLQIMFLNLPTYLNNIYGYFTKTMMEHRDFQAMIQSLNTNITDYITNIISPSIETIMGNITTGITTLISIVFNVAIGLIVSVYLIYDKEDFVGGLKKTLKATLPKSFYDSSMDLLNYTDKIFGGFMVAKIIDSIIIGIITFIILLIFRIPYASVISIIVGVTNIIPYFGPIIGAVPSAILLFLIDPKKCLTFLVIIILIQQFDGNILGPKIIGNKTGIKSFWVLFSILLFGGIFGFVGMIFGVPIFAVIYSLLRKYINKKLAKV